MSIASLNLSSITTQAEQTQRCTHTHTYMKTKKIPLIALIAACIIPTISQADHHEEDATAKKQDAKTAKIFARMDADKSSSISKEEATQNKRIANYFEKFDVDGSGELSLKEFEAAIVKKPKEEKKTEEEGSDEE